MDILYFLKELKSFRKVGRPSDSNSPVWKTAFDPLRKKWVTIPATALGNEKTTNLLALSDDSLLAKWRKAGHRPPLQQT
jgi:hypothetical protein